jgi:hypothetical protein
MKLLSFAEQRRSLWAGAFLFLGGAFSAYTQPAGSNVQINALTVDGSIDFADPDAASSPTRMYRAVPMPHPPSN